MKLFIRFTACCLIAAFGMNAQTGNKDKAAKRDSRERRLRAIEDREAILKTLHEYAFQVDFGKEVREYTDLYTEDAVFQSIAPPPAGSPVPADLATRANRTGVPGAVVGRHAIEEWITNEWRVRDRLLLAGHYRIHETIGTDITLNGDHASARSYFQTTDNDNGRIYMVSIGVYKDELVRSPDGRWRMKERLLIRQGAGANAQTQAQPAK